MITTTGTIALSEDERAWLVNVVKTAPRSLPKPPRWEVVRFQYEARRAQLTRCLLIDRGVEIPRGANDDLIMANLRPEFRAAQKEAATIIRQFYHEYSFVQTDFAVYQGGKYLPEIQRGFLPGRGCCRCRTNW
ncbi:MAG: hypothetical protein V4621_08260 [Pseudomonadota bacterium]